MKKELEAEFPLSREITVDGSRHLAREKVLQILNACFVSEVPWTEIFSHIFGRRFKFDEEENAGEQAKSEGRLLRSNEVYELDADIPINWQGGEIRFAQRLIEDVMRNRKMLEEILAEYAHNWDSDRIALIDKLLIFMAATEMITVEDMPIRVSINEAIDLGKKYSTEKSSIFINGIIESFINELTKRKLISDAKIIARNEQNDIKRRKKNKASDESDTTEK
ncbi:MAG: transcription antitermination factor NusB [Candidatus Kapabacteria bacterium]|nr:transcription antitermination factor NusB [Candidatus Kapabacteria bacterium]